MKITALLIMMALFPGVRPDGELTEAIDLYEKGKFSQAVTLLQQARDSSPAEAEIRLWLGKAYIKTRAWDYAVREMEKAVQIRPSNAQYHLWLGRACGERASHSMFIVAIKWARRVIKEFETAREIAPEDLDVRFDLIEYYLSAPAMLGGGEDKAEAEARAIAKLDSQKGYTARAIIYRKGKKWNLALKELTKSVSDHPESVNACKDLADYLLDRKDYEGALKYANKTLAMDGKSRRARLIAAAARIRLRTEIEEAEAALKELIEGKLGNGNPDFEEVHYWLGECHMAKGDKAKARESFQSALAYNPEYGMAKDGLSRSK